MTKHSSIYSQNWDEELLDEATGHKIVTIGNDVFELKKCERCGRWVPIEEFRSSKAYLDGRLPHCKACSHKRCRKTRDKSSGVMLISKDDTKQAEYVSTIEDGVKGLTSEISKLKARIQELEREQEKNRVDLNHLTEKEIEHVLRVNTVQPRMLFNAIKTRFPQLSFFCKDETTGLVSNIKTEVA